MKITLTDIMFLFKTGAQQIAFAPIDTIGCQTAAGIDSVPRKLMVGWGLENGWKSFN